MLCAALGALALLAGAAAPATADAAGCGLLGLFPCPPSSSPPAPDPGGDELADPPVPAPGMLVGFSLNVSSQSESRMSPGQEYDVSAAAGANTGRIDVFWSFMEPDAPSAGLHRYSQAYAAAIDARYEAMRARGMRPILILHSAPRWAQDQGGLLGIGSCSSNCSRFVEPRGERIADWEAFVRFTQQRYPDAAYEIWNEPNLAQFYRPAPSPANYLRLYLVAYRAIRAQDPAAEVLTGGIAALHTSSDGKGLSLRDFLGSLYRRGLKTSAPDFQLSVHVYPAASALGEGSRFAGQWDSVVDTMRAAGDLGRGVWVTETGISTSPVGDRGNPNGPHGLVATLDQQRDIMQRAYARMVTMDSVGDPARRLDVHAVLFHTSVDDPAYPSSHPSHGYGFLMEKPWLSPKPAFCWMVQAAPPGPSTRSYDGC